MADCRVPRLAHVANECLVLHADGGEAKLLLRAAVGTDGVGRQPGQLLDGEFCFWVRHGWSVPLIMSLAAKQQSSRAKTTRRY